MACNQSPSPITLWFFSDRYLSFCGVPEEKLGRGKVVQGYISLVGMTMNRLLLSNMHELYETLMKVPHEGVFTYIFIYMLQLGCAILKALKDTRLCNHRSYA